tara:strand:+ start:420 stop:551 length:132 start_codon:yes stop_codon:yes gene_type:complete
VSGLEKLDKAEVDDMNDADGGEGAPGHDAQGTADKSGRAMCHL